MIKKYIYLSSFLAAVFLLTTCQKDYDEPIGNNKVELAAISTDSIDYFTVKINSRLNNTGGNTISDYGLCWSTTPTPDLSKEHKSYGYIAAPTDISAALKNLIPGKKYYIRSYATIPAGTVYGAQNEFTTLKTGTPVSVTDTVVDITYTSALCKALVVADSGLMVTKRGICWSLTPEPTISGSFDTIGKGLGSYEIKVDALNPSTLYYVRAYAVNDSGVSYGIQKTFTTVALSPPSLTTAQIANITTTSALGGGNISSDGGSPVTARGVCWSIIPNPTIADNHTNDSIGKGIFNSHLTGLLHEKQYYVRAYATNSVGTSYGEPVIFSTIPVVSPVITTVDINNITLTTAGSGGVITSDGGDTITARGVCWSVNPEPITSNNFTSDGTGIGSYSSNLVGLVNNTTYYVRAYATNSAGTAYGNQLTFKTLAELTVPVLTTTVATAVTFMSAVTGGNISSNGGDSVIVRGVCWGTSSNPSISGNHTSNGSGSGSFISNLSGLSPATTYYVRAYATSNIGTAYGSEILFTTSSITLPTLTTTEVTNITTTTAKSGGNITSDGGATITAQGVCWSTSQTPTITDTHTTDGSTTGAFMSNITSLNASTTYYVRAYATNSSGTAYGSDLTFSTLSTVVPCTGIPTISYGGQVYNTVQIGTQCWLKENLNIGNKINSSTNQSNNSIIEKYCYNELESNCTTYGGLYQWNEMMQYVTTQGTIGICPSGWHIPSNAEWTAVTNYLGGLSSAGGKMKEIGIAHWAAPNTNATNESGFTSLPGGFSVTSNLFNNLGYNANFWASNEVNSSNASGRGMASSNSGLSILDFNKSGGLSVRCIKDGLSQVSVPTLTTTSSTNITSNSTVSGGDVTNDGGASVTARGVCWSINQSPSISDAHTADGFGTGTFMSSITGLNASTIYYVRAYATNTEGTAYGNQQSFTTLSWSCGSSFTINHIAGSIAPVTKTVSYGTVTNVPGETSKCWITKNLGADHQATSVDDATEASAGWYWQFNRKQGYKHDGTTRTPNTNWITSISENSDWIPSNDPCTIELGGGWRIPTNEEWTKVDAPGSQNWNSSSDTWNSDLKLHAAGLLSNSNGTLEVRGSYGHYWSRSQMEAANSWGLNFDIINCGMGGYGKEDGFPLRCISGGSSISKPTLTTSSISNVTSNSANSGGDITSDGGATITARGICWSTSQNPKITEAYSSDGSGTGTFTSSLIGLNASTTYYARTYATNSEGTAYGNQLSFTTLAWSCGSSFRINHVTGSIAPVTKTVTYGTVTNIPGETTKCWITQNLGADHQAAGYIDATEASAGWYWQFNHKQGYKHDGTTRTPNSTWVTNISENSDWQIANDPCNIELGSGWRIPTSVEWSNVDAISNWSEWVGPWGSGLRLHAAGNLIDHDGSLTNRGSIGVYCSSTQENTTDCWNLFFSSVQSHTNSGGKAGGFPLRCISGGSSTSIPTLTTSSILNVTSNSANSGGNITSDGGATVTTRGICWSTSQSPTTTDAHTTNGTGVDAFTSNLTGLKFSTTYYVRAYAINIEGTAYGNQQSFTTLAWSCGSPLTINHIAGSIAPVNKTVTYGTVTNIPGETTKCWITQNLGADHQAASIDDATEASAGWYWQFNRKQGYKHDGSTRTPNSTWINPIHENIDWQSDNDPCTSELGNDWHLPTFSEWANINLSGGWVDWNGAWNSGLKLHAAGYLVNNYGQLSSRGTNGSQWTIGQQDVDNGFYFYFGSSYSYMYQNGKAFGFSVRCLSGGSSSPFTIGQSYGGGVIFYIDGTGKHGLIAATTDQTNGGWCPDGITIAGADGTAIGTGQQNTIDIVNSCSTSLSSAARICSDLILNGYDDWFLPSKDELNQLYLNRTTVGTFLNGYYNSSSEASMEYPWRQNFGNGNQSSTSASGDYYVRAIRAF
jgi:uncharacterized protein (TIGR02145 family)